MNVLDSAYKIKEAHEMKNKKLIYICLACVIVAGLIGLFAYSKYRQNKTYSDYDVLYTKEIDKSVEYKYYKYASGVLCYTDDGMSYIKNGKEIWNHAYEMKNPVIDICGDYVAIGNFKSNQIHLYGIEGDDTTISTEYSLINVEVSEQGVVAAILEDEEANYFQITDKDGAHLVTGRTVLKGNGYPVDFSLSQDGTKMVVSYIYVSGGVSQSKVLFYNFSEIGQNSTDRMVGGFNQYTSTIVPEVEFVNNDTAVAIGDNMFTIYKVKEIPSLVKEIELEDRIKSVFHSEKYLGLVFESDDSQNAYTLKVYNLSGENIYTTEIDDNYTELQFAGDCILKYSDTACQLISVNDVIKFERTFDVGVRRMIHVSGNTKYILISSNKIETIELK